jgi:hypothetical protein
MMSALHVEHVLMNALLKRSARETFTLLIPSFAQTAALAPMFAPLKQFIRNKDTGPQYKKAALNGRLFYFKRIP